LSLAGLLLKLLVSSEFLQLALIITAICFGVEFELIWIVTDCELLTVNGGLNGIDTACSLIILVNWRCFMLYWLMHWKGGSGISHTARIGQVDIFSMGSGQAFESASDNLILGKITPRWEEDPPNVIFT